MLTRMVVVLVGWGLVMVCSVNHKARSEAPRRDFEHWSMFAVLLSCLQYRNRFQIAFDFVGYYLGC